MARRQPSTDDVFVNCPFDLAYANIFQAILFTIHACGFRPRSARELDDGGQARVEKLFEIIAECRYGIHDISRTELDPKYKLPRFNMPLELGIFLGAKRYGGQRHKKKRVLLLDRLEYRHQKFLSDLAAMDAHAHGNKPENAIIATRDWLANVTRRRLTSGRRLVTIYKKFRIDLRDIAKDLGLKSKEIPYFDFQHIVVNWLIEAPAGATRIR